MAPVFPGVLPSTLVHAQRVARSSPLPAAPLLVLRPRTKHGVRRAAEAGEVVQMCADLGLDLVEAPAA